MTPRRDGGDPPEIIFWLARWLAPPGCRENVEGDLAELWSSRAASGRPRRLLASGGDLISIAAARGRASRSARPPRRFGGGFAMRDDVRHAFRLMGRRPAFAALVVATLALGIGSSTAIFTLCDRVLLRPLPYPDPDRLVRILGAPFSFAGGHMRLSSSLERVPALAAAGLYATGGVNFGDGAGADRLRAAATSAGFFDVLAVAPIVGRTFTAEEDRDSARVAVISYRLWKGRLAGRADISTAPVRLNGDAFTIIGVMPEAFTFPGDVDVWLPTFSSPQVTGQVFGPDVIARIAPGFSTAQVRAALDAFSNARRTNVPDRDRVRALPLHADLIADVRSTLLFLAGGVALLFLATTSNVAGLFLSRLAVRRREMAMRRALGAPRWRLVRQVLIEAGVLAAAGGVLGLSLAVWILEIVVAVPLPLLQGASADLDVRMAAASVLIAIAAVALFGVGPALGAGLREDTGGTRTATWNTRGPRRVLVAAQVALALVLLAGAAGTLLANWRLSRVDVGFGRPYAMVGEITLPESRYGELPQFAAFLDRLSESLRAIPGVSRVAATSYAPGTKMMGVALPVRSADAPAPAPGERRFTATLASVSGEYFDAIGMRLIHGRTFATTDGESAPPVIVLSETAAARIFPGVPNPVGRRVIVGLASTPEPAEIVGIVNDVRFRGPTSEARPAIYLSIRQRPPYGPVSIVVDTNGPAAVSIDAVRRALIAVDSELPLYNIESVMALRRSFLTREQLVFTLSISFAAMTLMLVVIGLYGVLSQLVAMRTREIGIAMALGAGARRVTLDILRSAGWMIASGCAVGLAGVVWIVRVGESLVPGFTPPGPGLIGALVAVLTGIGILAAWMPARRAAAIDPVVTLRTE